MARYRDTGYEYRLSLVELQKLAYFLQAAGEPLRLAYTAHYYGPYADNLRKALRHMEGHFTSGVGDGRNSPETPVEIFLVPETDERTGIDDEADELEDELEKADDRRSDDGSIASDATKTRRLLPASLGMTVLLPPDGPEHAEVTLRYADYQALTHKDLAALGLELPMAPGEAVPDRNDEAGQVDRAMGGRDQRGGDCCG